MTKEQEEFVELVRPKCGLCEHFRIHYSIKDDNSSGCKYFLCIKDKNNPKLVKNPKDEKCVDFKYPEICPERKTNDGVTNY